MKYGKITAETTKLIGGLNAVVSINAGGSIVLEIPYAPDDDPSALCATLHQTLEDRDELFPERKKQITDEDIEAIKKRAVKGTPFDIVAHAIDGTHTYKVRLASGTDWLKCNCGSCLFTIAFAEFGDYSDGVIAQCQECGQILEIQKD